MVETAVDEGDGPSAPAVEGEDESPESAAALDPGVRKIMEKFPGRVRRADVVK